MSACQRSARAALLGLALTGCTELAPPDSTAQPKAAGDAQVAATRQALPSRVIGLIGTRAQHAPAFLGVPDTNFYCLRSFIDRQTGDTQHQLYVSDSYSGTERVWNAARNGAGHPLRFVEIGRNEITCSGGCSYAEEFAAVLPTDELRANPQGLAVTFTAHSGDEKTIVVSGGQISAQLAAVSEASKPIQPAAARSAASTGAHQ